MIFNWKQMALIGGNYWMLINTKYAIFEYIEVFYNGERIHSAIDYLSPLEIMKCSKNCLTLCPEKF